MEESYCPCGCSHIQDNGEVCVCCGAYLSDSASDRWHGYDEEEGKDNTEEHF